MPEWLCWLNPFYRLQKSNIELLAPCIADNLEASWAVTSMERSLHITSGSSSPVKQLLHCEMSYEFQLPKSVRGRKWQMYMLSEQVRVILCERHGESVFGYRFVYNEQSRFVSFYAQCGW